MNEFKYDPVVFIKFKSISKYIKFPVYKINKITLEKGNNFGLAIVSSRTHWTMDIKHKNDTKQKRNNQ